MTDSSDESTTFLRQRRDLFVISAILILIPIADITLSDSISMQQFGISMHIGKPEVIVYSLWVLWIYWFLRYFQAYKTFKSMQVQGKFSQVLINKLQPNLRDLVDKKTEEFIKNTEDIVYVNEPKASNVYQTNLFFTKAISKFEISAYESEYGGVKAIQQSILIHGPKYHLKQLAALYDSIFKHMEITECWLPFAFGFLPILLKLYFFWV